MRKKELSSGVVVYFALSLRMSLHVQYLLLWDYSTCIYMTLYVHVHTVVVGL